MIPSQGEAAALHRKYGSSEKIIKHCETVTKVARTLAEGFERRGEQIDVKAVVAGAMLHDIGRSQTQAVKHGAEGAGVAEKEGVDVKVVEMVRRHVGAGISPEEAKTLGLPDLNYVPHTLEERIVCFADKMVDGEKIRPFEEEVLRFTNKGHDVNRLLALKQGLQDELGEDPERLIFDKMK